MKTEFLEVFDDKMFLGIKYGERNVVNDFISIGIVSEAPLIFSTAGETKKRLAPVVFETIQDKERADFYNRHTAYSDETIDLYWLSKDSKELKNWLERKKKRPILTAHDFIWIDNMVDEVFEKHTAN